MTAITLIAVASRDKGKDVSLLKGSTSIRMTE
ncbi:hypothetical protein M2397_000838 [Pseudomonas sp. BIGb0381]|nr:hypothetical protein [Pseudomonas sp. BIGb0381]